MELYRTTSMLRCSLYRIQQATWRGFRADGHRLTNKKTRFTLIPEVRHRAATAELCPLKRLPETQNKHVQYRTTRGHRQNTKTESKAKSVTFHFLLAVRYRWTVCQRRSQSGSQCPSQRHKSTLCDQAVHSPERKSYTSVKTNIHMRDWK